MKALALFKLFLVFLVPAALTALPAASAPEPHILLILADSPGHGDVSCYSDQAKIFTPPPGLEVGHVSIVIRQAAKE